MINFDYKRDPIRCYYDIEVLNDIFTLCIAAQGVVHIVAVPRAGIDMPTRAELNAALSERLKDEGVIRAVGENPQLLIEILECESDDRETAFNAEFRLGVILKRFLHCRPTFDDSSTRFTEYYGWNSARYDLPMLAFGSLLLTANRNSSHPRNFRTRTMRQLSDIIIGTDGPQWVVYKEVEKRTGGLITENEIKEVLRLAAYDDGHIDIAKLARAQANGEEAKFPPGLKREMARYGLDIIIDELVAGQTDDALRASDINRLIVYNLNDVVGTLLVGRNKLVTSALETRDIVREMYPYTSAKAVPLDKVKRWNPPERDCTAAELAGRVLIGEKYMKPQDYAAISYIFPLPSGEHDLLEYIRETEEFVPDDLFAFFAHFRGQDTSTSKLDYHVKRSQPITHCAKINIPYYRDRKPIDCFIRVSTGGAHGSVMSGLSAYTEEEIAAWTRADTGAAAHQRPTLDIIDAIHLDWSSFYPTMASKMQLYKSSDGVDRYSEIIKARLEIKGSLNHDRSNWSSSDYDLFNKEQGLKFVLNNATGAGNMHSRFALLPVDNKTLSMRLIGNMLIWCLGQRLAQAGAFIVSTNTDGLYITGIDLQEVQRVVDAYVNDYAMPVEPEIVPRFINRDTSNRIEYGESGVSVIGGRLNGGLALKHNDFMISRNASQPLAVANAVIRYMDDRAWLTEPYSRDKMRTIVEQIRDESVDLEPWYHVHVGSATRKLSIAGRQLDKVNRVVLAVDGEEGKLSTARKLVKAQCQSFIDKFGSTLRAGKDVTGSDIREWLVNDLGCEPCDESILINDTIAVSGKKNREGAYESTDDITRAAIEHGGIAFDLCVQTQSLDIKPVRIWKESTNISGYPSNRIAIANSAADVKGFDLNRLDIEAYTDWAETLLLGWKVTADIPQIGVKFVDDPAKRSAVSLSSGTKKQRAIAKLVELYDSCLAV